MIRLRQVAKLSLVEPIAILAVWFVAAWPFLDPRTSVYGFDTLAYTGPNLQTTFDAWREFSIPLWQSDLFGGVPFLGRLDAQGLYFPHLPLMFFDVNTALDLGAAFHLLVLATGLYVLVKHVYRAPAPAAFVAATAVLSSSYVAVKMLAYETLVAIAWIPWLLICIEVIVRHPRRRSLAGPFAIVASLLVLGGHPQYIYFAALLSAGYVVLRVLETRQWSSLLTIALGGALSGAVSSLQLVAAYFLNSSSGIPGKRSLVSLANPAYVLPPSRLPVGVFGDPFAANPSQVTGVGEAILGLGLPVCLLAVIGLIFGRTLGRITRYGVGVGCFLGIILAVGPRWLPFRVFYDFVPGFGAARVAGRWLVIPLILGAVLAAEGVGVMKSTIRERQKASVVVLGAVIGLMLLWVGPFEVPRASLLTWWIAAIVAMAVLLASQGPRTKVVISWTWIAVFVAFGSLVPLSNSTATFHRSPTSFTDIPTPLVDTIAAEGGRVFAQTFDRFESSPYLIEHLRPNTNALAGVSSVDGYDGGQWIQERWIDMVKSLTNGKFATDLTIRSQTRFPLDAGLMRRFGVRWVLVDTSVVPADQQLNGFTGPIGKSGDVELWENSQWLGHAIAYLETDIRGDAIGNQLSSTSPNTAIVEDPSLLIECDGECSAQGVSTLYEEGDRSAYIFEILKDGVLVLDQGWSPDWKVFVDGVRAKSFPVNGNQVGVKFSVSLETGFHKVEFIYAPDWVDPLVALSVLGLLLSLVMSLVAVRLARTDNAPDELGSSRSTSPQPADD